MNLLSAVLCLVLFYATYALAFVLAVLIPLAFIQLGRELDRLVMTLTSLRVPPVIDQLTVLAAFYADAVIVYVFARTLIETFLWPTGITLRAMAGADASSSGTPADGLNPALARLVGEVTADLDVRGFSRVTVVAEPTVETSGSGKRRELILGWPLLVALSEEELKALIAHEAAHHDRHAASAQRWIWNLSQKVLLHQRLTERTLERLRLRDRRAGGPRLRLAMPMADSALRLSQLLLVAPQKVFGRRLGRGNFPFEFYCDAVAARRYGGNVLYSALETLATQASAFDEFRGTLPARCGAAGDIDNIFIAFETSARQRSVTERTRTEIYWRDMGSHPSLRSRLQQLRGFPEKPLQPTPWLDRDGHPGVSALEGKLMAGVCARVREGLRALDEGRTLAERGDMLHAGPPLWRAADLCRGFGEAQAWLGIYYAGVNRPDRAHACLLAGWRSTPKEVWERDPRFQHAFEKVAHVCGGSLGAWLTEGERLLKNARFDAALDAFDTLLAWNPSFAQPLPLFNKGRALEGLGRLQEARRCYEGVISHDPDNLIGRVKLANVIIEQVAARIWARRIVPAEPAALVALERMVMLDESDTAQLTDALKLCDGLLNASDDELKLVALATRAAVLRMLHRFQEAAKSYAEILRRRPDSRVAHEYFAACVQ